MNIERIDQLRRDSLACQWSADAKDVIECLDEIEKLQKLLEQERERVKRECIEIIINNGIGYNGLIEEIKEIK